MAQAPSPRRPVGNAHRVARTPLPGMPFRRGRAEHRQGVLTTGPYVSQTVSGTSTLDYGWSTLNLATSDGGCLVLLAGWDLSLTATDAAVPAIYVTDSADNRWYHVATTTSSVTGSRSSAWICLNAQAITWLSVSLTTFATSLAYQVVELANMPQYFSLDVLDATANSAATSLALAPGNTSQADIGFSVFTSSTASVAAPPAPSGWTALPSVSSGPTGAAPVQMFPYWRTLASSTSANTTYTISQSAQLSGITFAISATPAPPVQTNPNFPILKVEAAFGATPGDPSQAPATDGGTGLTWTDLTSYVIGRDGGPFITPSAGREYELATPEAGEMDIWLNNLTSAFSPANQSSPFWPDVVLKTPMRVSAFWGGRWYWVGSGWVERWPQEWPDLPQWGISQVKVTDAMGVLNSATMTSALQGDMLIDEPYAFLPASEQYLSFSNGVSTAGTQGSYSQADAQGLLAANLSRVNQRSAWYVDGTAATADTGQSTNLLGEENTGFGTSSIDADPVGPVSGPGVIYTDPNLPSPVDPNGVSVEFWVIIPSTVPDALQEPVVFTAYGSASNYDPGTAALSVQINNVTAGNTLTVFTLGVQHTATFTASANPQQIVLTMTASSLAIYVNGGLAATYSLPAGNAVDWGAFSLGNPNYATGSGGISVGNFTAFNCAVYDYILPSQRILSHYVTGQTGQENVDATTRIAQILAWANLGIGRGGQALFGTPGVSDGLTQGPAYGLSGSSAADAVNQVALNHSAMVAVMPSGSLQFLHKWALFNQSPAAVLGDFPALPSGEVPFLQASSFDYDDTYLYNRTQVTQQSGPNTTITATATDMASGAEYFTRSALQQTIQTTSDQDVFDQANWNLNFYSQPELRVKGVTIDASSNPQVAFPTVLQIQQGQAVTVTRRPVGGTEISVTCIVQKISHAIGPTFWQTSFELSPYQISANVLTLGAGTFSILGGNNLA